MSSDKELFGSDTESEREAPPQQNTLDAEDLFGESDNEPVQGEPMQEHSEEEEIKEEVSLPNITFPSKKTFEVCGFLYWICVKHGLIMNWI